jgi:hypothetical protein
MRQGTQVRLSQMSQLGFIDRNAPTPSSVTSELLMVMERSFNLVRSVRPRFDSLALSTENSLKLEH